MPLPEADEQEQDDLLAAALKNMLRRGRSMDAIMGEVRIRLITLALQQESGDRVAAARLLGISEDEL
jgi:DNA-binding NtrC family response regulator